MKKIHAFSFVFIFSLTACLLCLGSERCLAQTKEAEKPQLAGEFFGIPVSMNNYYFAKKAVLAFGASWRNAPQNADELEDLVWQELLFSYEAYRRGIKPAREKVEQEIDKMLKAQKVDFSFRVDREKYAEWVKEKLHMDVELFENLMTHLVQLQQLKDQVINSFDPEVTEEEAYNKFLDEYNTMLVELKQFDDKDKAQAFYEKAIVPVSAKDDDELIWQDMLYSYEAVSRGIEPDEKKVTQAIKYLLFDYQVLFNYEKDPDSYTRWIKDKLGMSRDGFEDMMKKISAVDTLIEKVASGEEKPVLDKKEYKEFRGKYPALEKAYAAFTREYSSKKKSLDFSSLGDARKIYAKLKRQAGFWEDQKRMYPNEFKRPGFVALDFLLHMWGFQRKDAYAMLNQPVGSYYPPAPIYKGYGVFKILMVRKADPGEFAAHKEDYLKKVRMIKQYELYQQWVKDLKEKANIKRYVK